MSTKLVNHIYKLKRGTEEAIHKLNPTLGAGEPIVVFCNDGAVRLKIGDGKTAYVDLKFLNQENDESLRALLTEVATLRKEIDNAGDSVFLLSKVAVNAIDDKSLSDRITKAILKRAPMDIISEGNIAIISGESDIIGAPSETVSYVYTGTYWEPITSTPSINDIVFDEDLIYTESIGSLEPPTGNGYGVLNTTGKTIKEVLNSILVKRKSPSKTNPSMALSVTNIGAFEVGSKVRVGFSVVTNPGAYEFDTDTGVTFSSPKALFGSKNVRDYSGTFEEITVAESTNLAFKFSVQYSDGKVPKDNLGDPDASCKITSGTLTKTHPTNLTGYRGWFWGSKTDKTAIDIDTLSSDKIRDLGSGVLKKFPDKVTATNMKQLFFAAPAGKVNSLRVTHSINGAPQTVEKLPTTIKVAGYNGYSPAEYDVFYINNDNATTATDTYLVTVS